MINLPLNEIWLPILGFIPIIVSAFRIRKDKKITRQSWFEISIGAFVLLISINDNLNSATEHKSNSDSLSKLHSEIISIRDTLGTTRDTLLKIGVSIDDKTGKILILDSQLLKKEFTNVFNVSYVTNSAQVEHAKYEEFTNSTSLTIKLAHLPIGGTESYTLNGIVIGKHNWSRTGTTVTFKGFSRDLTDVITATYSYK